MKLAELKAKTHQEMGNLSLSFRKNKKFLTHKAFGVSFVAPEMQVITWDMKELVRYLRGESYWKLENWKEERDQIWRFTLNGLLTPSERVAASVAMLGKENIDLNCTIHTKRCR